MKIGIAHSWLNKDPLGELGFEYMRGESAGGNSISSNNYDFVGNNPVISADSFGLEYGTGFAAYQECVNDCEAIRAPCKTVVALLTITGGGALGGPLGKAGGLVGAACGAIIGKPLDKVCDDAVAACKKACEKKTKYSPGKNKPRCYGFNCHRTFYRIMIVKIPVYEPLASYKGGVILAYDAAGHEKAGSIWKTAELRGV